MTKTVDFTRLKLSAESVLLFGIAVLLVAMVAAIFSPIGKSLGEKVVGAGRQVTAAVTSSQGSGSDPDMEGL